MTSSKDVKHDCIINDITSENGVKTWNNFLGLKEESTIVSSIVNSSFAKDITNWQNVIKRLPVNTHNFARRYLIFNLANNANLFRWKISHPVIVIYV